MGHWIGQLRSGVYEKVVTWQPHGPTQQALNTLVSCMCFATTVGVTATKELHAAVAAGLVFTWQLENLRPIVTKVETRVCEDRGAMLHAAADSWGMGVDGMHWLPGPRNLPACTPPVCSSFNAPDFGHTTTGRTFDPLA